LLTAVKNVDPKNKKNVDRLTKLIKSNERFPSKISVLLFMTRFQGYGSSWAGPD